MSYDETMLKNLTLKCSIEYRIEPGLLRGGSLDNVPIAARGAYVYFRTPIINPQGKWIIKETSYNLYVGEEIDIETLMSRLESGKQEDAITAYNGNFARIQETLMVWKNSGIKKVALTEFGPYLLQYLDTVYPTYDEMVAAIGEINKTFNSVVFTAQNSSQQVVEEEKKL